MNLSLIQYTIKDQCYSHIDIINQILCKKISWLRSICGEHWVNTIGFKLSEYLDLCIEYACRAKLSINSWLRKANKSWNVEEIIRLKDVKNWWILKKQCLWDNSFSQHASVYFIYFIIFSVWIYLLLAGNILELLLLLCWI